MATQLRARRAHKQMRGTFQYVGRKKGLISFLKRAKNPYDYDIDAVYVNESNGEVTISCSVTGDDWLNDQNQLDKN